MEKPVITRKAYLSGAASHREYYSQFAPIFAYAVRRFGKEKLKQCLAVDEHLNNIPLAHWDALATVHKGDIARINNQIGNGRVWSLADGVCAAKEAARQFAES